MNKMSLYDMKSINLLYISHNPTSQHISKHSTFTATNQKSTNTTNSHTNSVRLTFPCQFLYRGMLFHSVEHAYQKKHHGFHHLVNNIRACATATQAKSLVRQIPSNDHWNSI